MAENREIRGRAIRRSSLFGVGGRGFASLYCPHQYKRIEEDKKLIILEHQIFDQCRPLFTGKLMISLDRTNDRYDKDK